MPTIRSILVPLDGSALAAQALPWAADLARRADARITLAEVHHGSAAERPAEEHYIAARAEALRHRVREVRERMLEGPVVPALARQVTAEEADLVVMATHARSGVGRLWHGSVAETLVRRLAVPVLVIPPAERVLTTAPASTCRRIMVPLDGSFEAEAVLAPAMALAQLIDAELLLVMVPLFDMPPAPGDLVAAAPILVPGQGGEVFQEDARVYLDAVAVRVAARGCRVTSEVLEAILPAQALADRAAATDIGMVAIATHAGRVTRTLIGSVADQLLRTAGKPVLMLHSAGRQKAREAVPVRAAEAVAVS
ncbi:MAG TPA: universal stress protein [Gemmatimonadales bacterium]|nr:universal stress protein [Gemmatimonadales bacterium]